jgi:hypothetical protein
VRDGGTGEQDAEVGVVEGRCAGAGRRREKGRLASDSERKGEKDERGGPHPFAASHMEGRVASVPAGGWLRWILRLF